MALEVLGLDMLIFGVLSINTGEDSDGVGSFRLARALRLMRFLRLLRLHKMATLAVPWSIDIELLSGMSWCLFKVAVEISLGEIEGLSHV